MAASKRSSEWRRYADARLTIEIAVAPCDDPKDQALQHRKPVIGQAIFERVAAYPVAHKGRVVRAQQTHLPMSSLLRGGNASLTNAATSQTPLAARAELPVENDQRSRRGIRREEAIVEAEIPMNNRSGRFREVGLYPWNLNGSGGLPANRRPRGIASAAFFMRGLPGTGVNLLVDAGFGVLQPHPLRPVPAGGCPTMRPGIQPVSRLNAGQRARNIRPRCRP